MKNIQPKGGLIYLGRINMHDMYNHQFDSQNKTPPTKVRPIGKNGVQLHDVEQKTIENAKCLKTIVI